MKNSTNNIGGHNKTPWSLINLPLCNLPPETGSPRQRHPPLPIRTDIYGFRGTINLTKETGLAISYILDKRLIGLVIHPEDIHGAFIDTQPTPGT
jgi:hypothetical protein